MNCLVCNNAKFGVWGKTPLYIVLRCPHCGLGITSPFPTLKEAASVNQEKYRRDERIQTYAARHGYFQKRYRRQLRDIRSFQPEGKLLDIGCNIGEFLVEARAAGFNTIGIEMNRECAEYARSHHGLDVYSGHLDQVAFDASSFEIVTLYDVLEHVPDPKSLLLEIRRILKPSGLLVVQSPNLDSLMAKLTKAEWQWLCLPDHLYHFTLQAMTSLLAQSGFEVQTTRTWEPADVFWDNILQMDLRKRLAPRVFRKMIQISGLALPLTALLQRIWWHRQHGGLIEMFAAHGPTPP